jgi:AAA domain
VSTGDAEATEGLPEVLQEFFGAIVAPAAPQRPPVESELVPVAVPISPSLQRRLDQEPKADTSGQVSDLVRHLMTLGHSDGEVAYLAPQSAAYQAWASKNRSRSIPVDVARLVAKFRHLHEHVGQPCDVAGCPNPPEWMDPAMTIEEHRLRKVQQKVEELLILDEARQTVATIKADALFVPPLFRPSLVEDLVAQPEFPPETIVGLHRTGANAVIAAQYKAGKTTLVDNLIRALVDDEPFLGEYPVHFDGRVALFNYELDEGQMVEWLGNLGIRNPDRVTTVHLRGLRLPLIAERAQQWAIEFMLEHDIKTWILDPFARAFAGCGNENDNGEVGAFLDALDLVKHEAQVPDLWLTHHFGRKDHDQGQEHGRGATRLDDWPDVRWLLTRQHDDRFLKVHGRGVDVAETQLLWEPSGRLRLGGGTRQDSKRAAAELDLEFAVKRIVDAVRATPGASTRAIEQALKGTSKATVGQALRVAIESGEVVRRPGVRNAFQHFPADPEQGALL